MSALEMCNTMRMVGTPGGYATAACTGAIATVFGESAVIGGGHHHRNCGDQSDPYRGVAAALVSDDKRAIGSLGRLLDDSVVPAGSSLRSMWRRAV
jgi:hypothetical protein